MTARSQRISVAVTHDELAMIEQSVSAWIKKTGANMTVSTYTRDAVIARAKQETRE